ncbi:hypothetical protein BBK14_21305 [Parafrankia soli]|uniref:Methyltransferase n=1 Tax=Parafrankia soli TaxID=2599596 RepID=A0A1S1PYH6_9ACTN|nr:hypothetical protein BBK14_21305 [Parafrankia soli]
MDEIPTVDLRTDLPHSARMYDYYLGGKDNFPADRAAADQALHAFPGLQVTARQNRAFLIRATRHLAGELGIRQFLDIGTSIFSELYLSYGDDEGWRYAPSAPCPGRLSEF